MPYVPSKKTDGKSTDRVMLDKAVEALAQEAADKISDNLSLLTVYQGVFVGVANSLAHLLSGKPVADKTAVWNLATVFYDLENAYDYEGAFLGELNYAMTRFVQRVPQIKVANNSWTQELRYWLYARTVSALIYASRHTEDLDLEIDGVFEDIKDEYKRRVNTSYEAAQILKSGDCYDTPYYTRLVEVVDEDGNPVGHMEVMLKRGDETLAKDMLDGKIVLKKKN